MKLVDLQYWDRDKVKRRFGVKTGATVYVYENESGKLDYHILPLKLNGRM